MEIQIYQWLPHKLVQCENAIHIKTYMIFILSHAKETQQYHYKSKSNVYIRLRFVYMYLYIN